MATLKTRWLLSILLISLSNSFPVSGPPTAPSSPECYIPCDEKECSFDIYCTWDSREEPHTNYSLHWVPVNSEARHVINGTSLSRFIRRQQYLSHGELRVWVQAKNQHGSTYSQEFQFNTADIIKPPRPSVTSSLEEALEINWNSLCDQLGFTAGGCDVRHRTEADQVWHEVEDERYGRYTFESPQPCTVYEFQVRCACDNTLRSDWSAIHRIQGIDATPDAELDVWRDCGISPAGSNCVLIWKRLPQACGLILGYEVRLSYNDGTMLLVNVSVAEPEDQLVCDEMQCHFTPSLKDASSVSVSAYSAHGATVPSYLPLPMPGEEKNEQDLILRMDEENLTVSWELPSQVSNNQKEYVVQYKHARLPPGQAFDWIKVNKSQKTAFFKGHFEKYVPYQVSLFTVSHSNEVHHLVSRTGFSREKTPSRVPSFKVLSIADSHATLYWESFPLFQEDGIILYYQIGIDKQNVYNVSASPKHENKTFELLDLKPGQGYEVWIRAVTAVGPGENVTRRFDTIHKEYFVSSVVIGISVFMICVMCIMCILARVCCQGNKTCYICTLSHPCCSEKVPDPRNSHIFKQMKHQINDPMAWICIPVYEPYPEISLLEVVKMETWASKSSLEKTSHAEELTRPVVRDGSLQIDCQDDQREDAVIEECHRTDHKYGGKAYSKMVDSDEEREREDCWNSSEEEEHTAGYEKHFMPTPSEVQKVT